MKLTSPTAIDCTQYNTKCKKITQSWWSKQYYHSCYCNNLTSHHACVYTCFVSTKYKGIDDDSRYGGANYKAKNHIYREVGCKGHSDSKHSLKSDGQQQDETSAVPCTEREGVDMSLLLSTCMNEPLWQSENRLYRPVSKPTCQPWLQTPQIPPTGQTCRSTNRHCSV